MPGVVQELKTRFGEAIVAEQETRDAIPTLWVRPQDARAVLRYLKTEILQPYRFLYDLTAIDERTRLLRDGQPKSDFTVVYHLLSYERNADVRIKVALEGEHPSIPSIVDIWPSANW